MSKFINSMVVFALLVSLSVSGVNNVSASGQSRPQEPRLPYPYDEQEVVYENKKDGVQIAGTLTLPRSKGLVPAVLLITGSGPQDRNETLLGHKPFLVLADHLTRLGIAVLRVDDRGVGKSTGKFSEATSEDFAADVLAGVEYLKTRKEINPRRIGLIGHSEGGLIAPMVAAKSTDIAFIVMMAGQGLTGEEILYLQGALISKADGVSDDFIAQNRAMQERVFAIVKREKDGVVAERKIREEAVSFREIAASKAEATEEQKKTINVIAAAIESQAKFVVLPWFRFFLTYNPRPALMKVKCPVLAINGEKDLQVPAKENLAAIRQALEAGGNKDYTSLALPNLNHLFQTCRTGAISEYAQIEETISPVALNTISNWILKHTNLDR
ncbi:MAG TPA: alpha/beta fold hydrolase [Blastocatellia bacterium]